MQLINSPMSFRYIHGVMLLGETILILGAAVMEFADGVDAKALLLQAMTPGRYGAVVGKGVVRMANLVDIATSGQGCTTGDADRTIRIGMGETTRPRTADEFRLGVWTSGLP